jgi:hypothetical protein
MIHRISLLLLFFSTFAIAQVQLTVTPSTVNAGESITAAISNKGTAPISFCMDYTDRSIQNAASAAGFTPNPFRIEVDTGRNWDAVADNPAVTPDSRPEVLPAGSEKKFQLVQRSKGNRRLVLLYWRGADAKPQCSTPSSGAKRVQSKTFVVK